MLIVGLDTATQCGWCILDDDRYVDGGTVDFSVKKTVAQSQPGQRWHAIRQWLYDFLSELKPDFCYYELVARHASTMAAWSYGYWQYTLQSVCYELGLTLVAVPVGTWKKKVVCNGAAKKPEIMAAITGLYPMIELVDDNHADAMGIATFGRWEQKKVFATNKTEIKK